MPLRLSKIEDVNDDLYYKYKVILSEHVDEMWYNIIRVAYFVNYMDAVDTAQCWENHQ
jgi:hypothetical protein